MSKALSNLFILVIAAVGILVTLMLTYMHFNPGVSVGCTAGPTGCHGVLQSAYGHIGPLPTSLIGMGMYLVFIGICLKRKGLLEAWRQEESARVAAYASATETGEEPSETSVRPIPTPERTQASALPGQIRILDMGVWALSLLAFVTSWWLQFKALFEIGALCPWCLTSAFLVTMIFALASRDFLLDGRKLQGEQKMLAGVSAFILLMMGVMMWPIVQRQLDWIAMMTQREKYVGTDMREALIDRSMHIKGDPNSKVVVIEFADYQCPACGQAFKLIHDYMEKDPKRFRLAFRQFPLAIADHPWSRYAAGAAEAAGKQNKFWEMHEYIFSHQKEMKEQSFTPVQFGDFAKAVGLNLEKFKQDVNSKEVEERVKNDMMAAQKAGVDSTPTFFFVTRTSILMVRGQEAFQKVMDDPKHAVWTKAAAGL